MGIRSMVEIRGKFGNVLNKLITQKFPLKDYKQAFKPEKEDIKIVIDF